MLRKPLEFPRGARNGAILEWHDACSRFISSLFHSILENHMANRNPQGERYGQRGTRDWRRDDDYRSDQYRSRDDDEGRYSSAEDEGDYGGSTYGPYRDTDEGDSSVRAGNYDQGRQQSRWRDTNEQSGSTGRYAGYGDFGQGDYSRGRQGESGQGRYGQNAWGQRGYGGGNYNEPNYGYGRSGQERGSHGGRGQGSYGQTGYGRQGSSDQGAQGQGAQGWSGYGQGGRGTGQRYGQEYGSSGTSMYGRSSFGGYASSGNWNEPYGEGQQYTSRGDYAGEGAGLHRGKGPKGYQRSDERLKELLCERLRDDPHVDPSEVTISVQGGKITLDGTVDSRQTKNIIEDIAEQFGVQEVQNNLRVQRQTMSTMGTESGKSASGKGSSGEEGTSTTKQKH